MKKKILWITETAVMLAMLIVLQAVTKPLGQFVTGSCVNAVLAISLLIGGPWSGVLLALISPVLAFLLGIAPNVIMVPAIMTGNLLFILALYLIVDKSVFSRIMAWLVAAVVKFGTLQLVFILFAKVFFGQMPAAVPAALTWPQLVTALIGGGLALLIAPTIRKALKR